MAASDKPFNNQRTLDIVFAVSNILMLLSIVWMLWQDHFREYKVEQRLFRQVEVGIAQRTALDSLPSAKDFNDAEADVVKWRKFREDNKDELASARTSLIGLRPQREKADAAYQTVKADVESFTSLLAIAIEHGDTEMKDKYVELLKDRNAKLVEAQKVSDDVVAQMKLEQLKIERVEGELTKAVAAFKKVNDRLDSQVKLALTKRWTIWDWLRTQPVINGFADPLKIQQFTIDDIPIDYNFKKVTRFDRCMTCHLGIDKPGFTRENLMALTKEDVNKGKLDDAIKLYEKRLEVTDDKDKGSIPNPNDLRLITLSDTELTPSRVTEFCAHPRLDLYVGSNSKHPAEKFGCTSCHSGQGSGTAFIDASHSPNSMEARKAWSAKLGWEFNHQWDFPMAPTRFVESSCLKCHHEVTDLVSSDNRVEAPKLLRGHQLIRENGCFGCHEISGWKSGMRVGPDLRLEPSPPLEDLLSTERIRAENDTDNRPGTLRKVGPALTRVSEKVDVKWIEKWLSSPTTFRPDTKMPHYYGLSTNSKDFLIKNADDQKNFPDTEMAAIAFFLTKTSKDYLDKADALRKKEAKEPQANTNDLKLLQELLNKGRLEEKEQKQSTEVRERIKLRKIVPLEDLTPKDYKVTQERIETGRVLFIERGCLACHTHQGTEKTQGNAGKPATFAPSIKSEAVFGPNLTQVAEKFADRKAARKWLVQWIIDPHVHSPRSRMPVMHLTPQEATDVAEWLLAQPPRDKDDPWHKTVVEQPERKDLESLARVYLTRMLSKSDMDRFFKGISKADADKLRKKETPEDIAVTLLTNDLGDDEKNLLIDDVTKPDSLKFYLGKKAVSRLGCFGCHDIPGFESAKSIGVGLNDWGKKPSDRLAFEDIANFYNAHYQTEDPHNMKDGKQPYDPFYKEALIGHYPVREGYLNQKIRDPRSYDYNRIRAWDDRARMPQFTLARPRKKDGEKEDDFKGRIFKEEADAREAVATFVLGLVAEPIPVKSINQPKGDRLAEIKGRQVLDKYNCNGCHMIRPGVYDFKPSPASMDLLVSTHGKMAKQMKEGGEIEFPNHINWVGRNPVGADKLTAFASLRFYEEGKAYLTLNEALRFRGPDKKFANIPAGTDLTLPVDDFGVAPATLKTQDDFDRRFASVAPSGGRFGNLLAPWLIKKDKAKYPADADARGALPPTLVGEGERTQPDWLYNFLLNPQPIRRLTILQMPKFNMSKEEAGILRDYFAAVTRQTNPGIGLAYPNEVIPSREDFSGDYWRKKTADYVTYLKDKKLFDARLKAYEPVFEQVRREYEPGLKAKMDELNASVKKRTAKKSAVQTNLDALKDAKDEKDLAKKAELEIEVALINAALAADVNAQTQTKKAMAMLDEKAQRKAWETQDAYGADAYRMLSSRELCTKCHQVGNVQASAQDQTAKQGPPLDLAFSRLRPDWVERWVSKPQRFVPYQSLMIAYFNKDKTEYQNLHAGPAHEQILALRDALMNFDRLSVLPINRVHNPDRK